MPGTRLILYGGKSLRKKRLEITKCNIFLWPIRNLIKISVVFNLFYVILIIIGMVNRNFEPGAIRMLLFMLCIDIVLWGIVILGIGSYRSYIALYMLRRQEKYLHVNMEKELAGKEIKGSSFEAIYEDENWFISYGGSYINVFHKKYIENVSAVKRYVMLKDVKVTTKEGGKMAFVVSNLYDSSIWKFKKWCQR